MSLAVDWSPFAPAELRRYAGLIVRGCTDLKPGDQLLLLAGLGHRQLAIAVAEEAYRSGAHAVDVLYTDNRVQRAKIELACDDAIGMQPDWKLAQWRALGRENVAFVEIRSDFEPDVLPPLPAARAATDAAPRVRYRDRLRREHRLRGTICTWPTREWAVHVYPELAPRQAQRQLAEDLLLFCRIAPDDPPGHAGWTRHLATLRARAQALTDLDLTELRVRDGTTDLRLRLAPFSRWAGGGETDRWGHRIAMNLPTEECFISPQANATVGTFRCSRPLIIAGRTIEGLSGEFRNGKLVRLRAERESDRAWFASYLAAVPNAERVGEIALVDRSSRIGTKARTYCNALLDENAAAHFAFGSGLPQTRTTDGGRKHHGLNHSDIHIDVMIGSGALTATATTREGRKVSIIADGCWQPELVETR